MATPRSGRSLLFPRNSGRPLPGPRSFSSACTAVVKRPAARRKIVILFNFMFVLVIMYLISEREKEQKLSRLQPETLLDFGWLQ